MKVLALLVLIIPLLLTGWVSKPTYKVQDEFTSLNTDFWYTCPEGCYPPNNELEVYQAANVSVHDGV
jgi:hypothetical protein